MTCGQQTTCTRELRTSWLRPEIQAFHELKHVSILHALHEVGEKGDEWKRAREMCPIDLNLILNPLPVSSYVGGGGSWERATTTTTTRLEWNVVTIESHHFLSPTLPSSSSSSSYFQQILFFVYWRIFKAQEGPEEVKHEKVEDYYGDKLWLNGTFSPNILLDRPNSRSLLTTFPQALPNLSVYYYMT